MRVQIPTNHNYYGRNPILEEELKVTFGLRNARQLKPIKDDLFGATYELNTKNAPLEQIKIFGFKSQRNKLEEEQLILKLYCQENQQKEREYFIQTGLFAGVIYHKNCQFNITTAYGDLFLKRMLNYINDIYVDNRETTAQKSDASNEFQHILAYLFIQSLERAASMGLPQIYLKKRYRGVKVRGKIDVNDYLRKDIPFQGKLTTSFRERVYVQEIIDVLYLACRKLEKSFGKEIHKKIHGTYQLLRENYSGSYPTQAKIKLSKNHSSLLNPVYSSYKKVLTYAEIILKDLDLEHSTTEQSQHTHGYLFDISQLFEVYLEKLLSRKFSDWLVSGQEEIIVYPSPLFYRRKMFPDIVMRHNYTGKVIVFDAKFKKMSFRKNDLDRGDFYQIHSYIQYYQSEVILGGLIYPLSKELCKRKTYSNSIFGKKTTDQFFIVEGIYVDETMEMSKIIENEEKFIFRIQETIDAIFQENSSLNSIKL